jgi:CHAT domain-containing protein
MLAFNSIKEWGLKSFFESSLYDGLGTIYLQQKKFPEALENYMKKPFWWEPTNTWLIVLSACETGLGKLSSGDELVGLTRAFIYAGTPSIVARLWNVEDSSTAQLMASFYKNLKTMTKVEALRQAQLQLIRGNTNSELLARRGIGGVGKLGETSSSKVPTPGSEPSAPMVVSTSHPYFWAPFILVGDGK